MYGSISEKIRKWNIIAKNQQFHPVFHEKVVCENLIRCVNFDFVLEKKFEIVFDAVGKTSKSKAKKVFKKGGRFVSVKSLTSPKQEHLIKVRELAEEGKVKPYIDKCFPLSEIVYAHEYVDKGKKKGNLVIEIVN